VDRRVVHLHPVGSGATLRWQITPPPPAAFRGGPLLNSQGQLIAVAVLEGGTLIGMPIGSEMLAMVDVAAGPQPVINATTATAPVKPASEETATVPKVTESKPSVPPAEAKTENVVHPRQATKAAPPETLTATNDKPTAAPEDLTSVFKDAAIAPLHVEAPVVPKPRPTVSGPTVTSVNVPLSPIRTTWAWKAAAPPPIEAPATAPQVAKQVAPPPQKTEPPATVASAPPPTNAVPPVTPPPATSSGSAFDSRAKDNPSKVVAVSNVEAKTTPRDVNAFLQEAAELMQKKDYAKAVDTLEEAVRVHPEAANLNFQLALAYWYKALQKPDGSRRTTMEKASYHKAIKSFQTFLEKAPNDPLANEARMRLTVLRNAQYGGG
jgi:TolA-binding protein